MDITHCTLKYILEHAYTCLWHIILCSCHARHDGLDQHSHTMCTSQCIFSVPCHTSVGYSATHNRLSSMFVTPISALGGCAFIACGKVG